ncbi:MAG: bifunctional 5,10-methylenetetrahydrofolate dehydrogenase/5,10-methenyltetrahydrofolate cyclohydrolase [Parcubacteria group bacterium]|nr:bifunctional 5,10-methylenetetrahydrofolate dehydrogenase/5,10-methenyltetrahydrofolate cyclohydrolase [Parcubacteria group bacterium]
MIVDGRAIAAEIKEELKARVAERTAPPTLFVFIIGDNPVSERFLSVKKKFASDVGVTVEERRYDDGIATLRLASDVEGVAMGGNRGVIVQLPLPDTLDTARVLDAIPPHADPDMLSVESQRMFQDGRSRIVPPVVAALREILERNNVTIKNKNVVIIGKGRLVGAPAAVWLRREGGKVTVLDSRTPDIGAYTKDADIIVSGAGRAGLITPDVVKEGVVILDAATSETPPERGKQGGKLAGDADPACAEKASVFTPVPGGIGPITVAMLFKNLLLLTNKG